MSVAPKNVLAWLKLDHLRVWVAFLLAPVATLLLAGCAYEHPSPLPPPVSVYECRQEHQSDDGHFRGVRYLDLQGAPAGDVVDGKGFHEKPMLNWRLSRGDRYLGSIERNPWRAEAYNYLGHIVIRVHWAEAPPVGTRIFLEIPGTNSSFEGWQYDGNGASSGVFMNWFDFKEATAGQKTAFVVFTTPEGREIQRNEISLGIFHTAANRLDQMRSKGSESIDRASVKTSRSTLRYNFSFHSKSLRGNGKSEGLSLPHPSSANACIIAA